LIINIKAGCYNAGQLNEIGKSEYDHECETLIPPYSHFKCTKIAGNKVYLDLAKDNQSYPLVTSHVAN
jgi:hypothetical protein